MPIAFAGDGDFEADGDGELSGFGGDELIDREAGNLDEFDVPVFAGDTSGEGSAVS